MMSMVVKTLPSAAADSMVQSLLNAGFAPRLISVVGPQGETEGAALATAEGRRWLLRAVLLCALGGIVLGVIEVLWSATLLPQGGLNHAFTGLAGALAGMGLGGIGIAAFGPITAMLACASDRGEKGHAEVPPLGPGEVAIFVDAGQRADLAQAVLNRQLQPGSSRLEALPGPRSIPAIANPH